MKEFIIDFLLAETEEETEITMKEMKRLMDSSSPEIKEVLNAIYICQIKINEQRS